MKIFLISRKLEEVVLTCSNLIEVVKFTQMILILSKFD